MTGIVWFVQINHYPLFLEAGKGNFSEYEKQHALKAGRVIAPVMVAEALSTLWLAVFHCSTLHLIGAVLLAAIWASTFFVQVPLHQKLSEGFDAALVKKLIRTNWLRTFAWTLRASLLAFVIMNEMP